MVEQQKACSPNKYDIHGLTSIAKKDMKVPTMGNVEVVRRDCDKIEWQCKTDEIRNRRKHILYTYVCIIYVFT